MISDGKVVTKGLKLLVLDVDGTLTDGAMYYSQNGEELKRFHTRDGMGIRLWESRFGDVLLLTSEDSKIAIERANKLKIQCHVGCKDKGEYLDVYFEENGLSPENVVYMGDDINDLSVIGKCKYFACPNDAHPDVIEVADLIASRKGGNGAVRELVDFMISMSIDTSW